MFVKHTLCILKRTKDILELPHPQAMISHSTKKLRFVFIVVMISNYCKEILYNLHIIKTKSNIKLSNNKTNLTKNLGEKQLRLFVLLREYPPFNIPQDATKTFE